MSHALLFRSVTLSIALGLYAAAIGRAAAQETTPGGENPQAIATFHSLGLYWSPSGGSTEREVLVAYRPAGEEKWREGVAMRYLPIPGTDEDLADYRGSIVHLKPGTKYEIRLTLAGTKTDSTLTAATWSEDFPAGETVRVQDGNQPLAIRQSGTPDAWRVYDGHGAVIDVDHQHNECVTIDASYVILRNLTLKGAGAGETSRATPIGAITVLGGHDIVIENCEITDWGRFNPKTGFGYNGDSALFSRSRSMARLIVQRCKMHHPTYDGSTWHEPKYPTHTAGPQCITLNNTAGNHVIRYSEFWSDLEHMYNDVIGGASNGSFEGAPGPDSDIYGNVVMHCWDDGLEVEGGNRNVRVWGNYISQSLIAIGNAATSIGPLYIWRNVAGRCQVQPDEPGYNFLKMGFANSEDWMTGSQYIFHNTVFDEDGWLPRGGLGGDRIVKHTVSRNNILHVRSERDRSASSNDHNIDNDFDYDLYNGRVPEEHEKHGVRGTPVYVEGAGFNFAKKSGRFELAPESPGVAAGEPIPNFNGTYEGTAPDIGAHQTGTPAMRFKVQ